MGKSVWLRTALGFLVAPISPGLLVAICAAILGFGKPGEGLWVVKLSAMLGYPIAVTLGLPVHLFLKSRGWTGLLVYIAAGAFLGIVVYLVFLIMPNYSDGVSKFELRELR